MLERHLLILALCTAVIGIGVIAVLPELPEETLMGMVEWTNGTTVRIAVTEDRWVRLASETPVQLGTCVTFSGKTAGNDLAMARVLPDAPGSHRRCRRIP